MRTAPGSPTWVGIGLALSRTLARLMDGDLIYDRVGGESVFELGLPMMPPVVDGGAETSLAESVPTT